MSLVYEEAAGQLVASSESQAELAIVDASSFFHANKCNASGTLHP